MGALFSLILKEKSYYIIFVYYSVSPPAVPSQRSVLHRVLVCAAAALCLPIILGLACCLSSEVKPRSLSRMLSTHTAVYRDHSHPAPQPPPRCPVPQKCSTSSGKGILYSYFVACNTDIALNIMP